MSCRTTTWSGRKPDALAFTRARLAKRFSLWLLTAATLLFISASRLDLWNFWAYIAISALFGAITAACLTPSLTWERLRPQAGGMDRLLGRRLAPFFLCHWTIAGLDAGHLSIIPHIPQWLQVLALFVMIGSLSLNAWAVRANEFFSPVIRIQKERGHRLVTDGPYGLVRHPGYLGAILFCVSSGLLLGSWLALIPLFWAIRLLVRRTILEDRLLLQRLDGYAEYSKRVTSHLIPGVW